MSESLNDTCTNPGCMKPTLLLVSSMPNCAGEKYLIKNSVYSVQILYAGFSLRSQTLILSHKCNIYRYIHTPTTQESIVRIKCMRIPTWEHLYLR